MIGNVHDEGSSVILGTDDGGETWQKVTFSVPPGAPNYYGQSFLSMGPISCPTTKACVAIGAVAQGSKTTPVYSYRAAGEPSAMGRLPRLLTPRPRPFPGYKSYSTDRTISTEISTAGTVPLFSSQCVVFLSSGQPTPGP